jgi:peptidyl-prolyl cis-trans isomerase D
LFALDLRGIIAPELPPLAEVRDQVRSAWVADSNAARVLKRAQTAAAAPMDAGLAEETITGLARDGFLESIPQEVVESAFSLGEGQSAAVAGADATAYVVRVDTVIAPDMSDPEIAAAIETLRASMAQGLAADVFEAYGQAVQAQAGLTLNQTALNAVHASFGQGQF